MTGIFKTEKQRREEVHALRNEVKTLKNSIADLEQSNQALIENQDLYQQLFESSQDAIFVFNFQGQYHQANPAALNLIGYSPTELNRLTLDDLFPEKLGKSLPQHLLAWKSAGVVDLTVKHKDGTPINVEVVISSLNEGDGQEMLFAVARKVSERRQLEAHSCTTSNQFRTLLENSQPIIFLIDRNGVFTLSEGLGLSVLGLEPGQVVGQSAFDLYAEVPEIIAGMNKALAGEIHREVVQVGEFHFDTFYSPLRDEDGQIDGLLGMGVDVTERVQAMQKVTASENKYRALFDAAGDAIFIADAETGMLLDANRVAQQLVGRDLEEIRRMNQFDLHPPEDKQYYQDLFHRHANLDVSITDLVYVQHKDGSRIPVEVNANAIDLGDRQAIQGIFRDISERIRFQDQLLLQSSALNAAANAILITDRQGEVLWVNPAFTQLTGYELERIVGRSPSVLRSGEHDKTFFEDLWQTIMAGKCWKGIITNRRKDGTSYVCEQTITPVINRQGEVENFIGIQHDVTERIRFEQDIQRRLLESDSLREISLAGASLEDEDKIIETATRIIGEAFYSDHFGLLLIDYAENTLLPHPSYIGLGEEDLATIIPVGEGISGQVAAAGKPMRVPDVGKANEFIPSTKDMRSELCVPLVVSGKTIGVINVESARLDAFSQEDEQFLLTLSGYLATAIERTRLHRELISSHQAIEDAYNKTLEGWAAALELRDHETQGHTERVTEMTLRLAERMGISGDDLVQIQRGSILHDIGKIGIPDSILFKAGPLSDREWEVMRRHPNYAYDLLSQVPFLKPALVIPLYHHEYWDGSGYPHGLKGEEIPIEARIFAVIDTWDALSSGRPYRPAWNRGDVIQHIKEKSGKKFDPGVVEHFIAMLSEKNPKAT
ncbi:MAG: PAS domain S-box protein [Anaerolineae bacterium]|nr:PAS domain S-box protein [Anaerolineae bacterium]